MKDSASKVGRLSNGGEGKTSKKRILKGVVVSDKMKDTIVVAVTRFTKHPKYQKFMKSTKKYHAHDAGNTHEVGDKVEIAEVKPISKTKSFEVLK
ncbi:MAG: 30S ribosomal protein S17 [Parcubacteria group bacterium]|nr:30S ribosomal protein S17 [Parcubacteria group bacterium]